MLLGAAFVYSATMVERIRRPRAAGTTRAGSARSSGTCWGSARASALCFVDYHTLARWSFVAYWVAILLLVAVLIPGIGSMRFGARRWIDLGFFSFSRRNLPSWRSSWPWRIS